MNIYIEVGRVTPYLRVVELTIREIEADDDFFDDSDDNDTDEAAAWVRSCQTECRVQGRIENVARVQVDNVRYDVSYYSREGRFLGLDKSHFLDDDEMESGDTMPIDMPLNIPEDAARCVFNVRAKRANWIKRII